MSGLVYTAAGVRDEDLYDYQPPKDEINFFSQEPIVSFYDFALTLLRYLVYNFYYITSGQA